MGTTKVQVQKTSVQANTDTSTPEVSTPETVQYTGSVPMTHAKSSANAAIPPQVGANSANVLEQQDYPGSAVNRAQMSKGMQQQYGNVRMSEMMTASSQARQTESAPSEEKPMQSLHMGEGSNYQDVHNKDIGSSLSTPSGEGLLPDDPENKKDGMGMDFSHIRGYDTAQTDASDVSHGDGAHTKSSKAAIPSVVIPQKTKAHHGAASGMEVPDEKELKQVEDSGTKVATESGLNKEQTSTQPATTSPSEGGSAVAAKSGAMTAEDPNAGSVTITAEEPGEILEQLANVPPSAAFSAYTQAESASATALENQKNRLQASLPEIPAPTGLSAKESQAREEPARETESPSASLKGEKTGREGEIYNTKAVEAPPPTTTSTVLPEGTAVASSEADNALARNAQGALGSIQLDTRQINTHAGSRPGVDLTGEADTGQISAFRGQSDNEVATSKNKASKEIYLEHGENDIYPEPTTETLTANKVLSAASSPAGPNGEAPPLAPEARMGLDVSLGPVLKDKVDEKRNKYAAGREKYENDVVDVQDKADTDIASKKEEAKENQINERQKTQQQVATYKMEWQEELDNVEKDYQTKSEKASTEQSDKIKQEKRKTEEKANKHLDDAEKKAADEKLKATKKANEEKQKTKKESGGFWGWVKSKASALIDGLKQAVNFIYDGLRKVVKGIFELAKKLYQGVIELGRMVIVGLIKGFGMILKGLISVVFVAFPDIARKINKKIDVAVNVAVKVVNKVAQVLKDVVSAILDFLASTLDAILGFIQDLYNGLFTLIGMLIRGEFKEIMEGLSNLVEAAKKVPELFEIAAYEELLGGDLDKPLSPAELAMASGAGISIPGKGAATPASTGGNETSMPSPPWTSNNVGVDSVANNMLLSPEIIQELLTRTNGDGEVEIASSDDQTRTMASVMSEVGGQQAGGETEQANIPDDGLKPMQRAKIKWEIMKAGLAKWWQDNKVLIIAGSIAAIVGIAAAIFFSGGAILAAIPPLMSVLGPLFLGATAAILAGHVRDYVAKSWKGDIRGGGKSLSKGLAAGAIELISWLTFKAGGAVLKGAKAVAKGGVTLAKGAVKGIVRAIKAGAKFLIKNGKVLFKGIKGFAIKQFKRLKDLGKAILQRMRVRKITIKLGAGWFEIWAYINPPFRIAKGKFKRTKNIEFGESTKKAITKGEELRTLDVPAAPGSKAHMEQRWVEHQLRNPDRFPTLTEKISEKWSKLYDTIIKNKRAGGAFERKSLGSLGKQKNSVMMMDDVNGKGFIPDAVDGNHTELIWGRPYRFTEIKGWKDMSNTGNLKSMIEYVKSHGGHLTVVFRPDTSLTGPLNKILTSLERSGRATIIRVAP